MEAENTRRRGSAASTTTQVSKPSAGQNTNTVRADLFRWLNHRAIELRGAIEDHRKWVNSDRARTLGTTFELSGRLFTYAAYIALVYLAFNCYIGIRNGLAAGVYIIPEQNDGSRVALFNMLAAGLVGPLVIIAIGVGIGWLYNLTTATAHRLFPRFVQPWVHPSILFAVVAAFAAFHSTVTATAAKSWLYVKTNIEAASPKEVVSIKVIEIPGPVVPSAPEATGDGYSSERELVRLKSMFNSARPCSKDGQGTTLNPQSEVARPEPGLAPSRDCQAETTAPHD